MTKQTRKAGKPKRRDRPSNPRAGSGGVALAGGPRLTESILAEVVPLLEGDIASAEAPTPRRTTRPPSTGTCSFCTRSFNKAQMTRHVQSCERRPAVAAPPARGRRSSATPSLHLVAEGRYAPEYWLHLEAPADAPLDDLDALLRDTWLECCGHLSAFTIEGQRYQAGGPSFPGLERVRISGLGFDDEADMDVPLSDVLAPGLKFRHEYDFGTTTELNIRVVSEGERAARGGDIQVLARNDPPALACVSCGKNATKVCSECVYSGAGWLCGGCARKHPCGEDMLLPVVNSPRVGACGYAG